jgi:hypothetical protein
VEAEVGTPDETKDEEDEEGNDEGDIVTDDEDNDESENEDTEADNAAVGLLVPPTTPPPPPRAPPLTALLVPPAPHPNVCGRVSALGLSSCVSARRWRGERFEGERLVFEFVAAMRICGAAVVTVPTAVAEGADVDVDKKDGVAKDDREEEEGEAICI